MENVFACQFYGTSLGTATQVGKWLHEFYNTDPDMQLWKNMLSGPITDEDCFNIYQMVVENGKFSPGPVVLKEANSVFINGNLNRKIYDCRPNCKN